MGGGLVINFLERGKFTDAFCTLGVGTRDLFFPFFKALLGEGTFIVLFLLAMFFSKFNL
ncbi:MAG: hypothetical protein Q7J14_00400 [Candidatus Magasanikbacteria bacterium]|nr:hypothetical protein [Candidatus Magasanikbacteria bacterium]